MRKLTSNNHASIVPVILFVITIFGSGALYSLFFLEVAQPTFDSYIPAGDSKTFIMMGIYALPLIVLIVGIFSLFVTGLKKRKMESGRL